jgi:hypothetical protein
MCSNWQLNLVQTAGFGLRSFFNFRTSAGRGGSPGRLAPFGFRAAHPWGLGYCPGFTGSVQGAGGRGTATGEPPQMGTSGSQRRGFRRTRAGAGRWGAGCGGSGRRFGAPSGPFRCPGSSGVVWRASKTRWNPLERHRGGAGLVTATYQPSVREDIRANALDPPRTQNPGLESPLTQGVWCR